MAEHQTDTNGQASGNTLQGIPYAVWGDSQSGIGVFGTSRSDWAVGAISSFDVGVAGLSFNGNGVWGVSFAYKFGVVGNGGNAGVLATNPNNDHAAYLASVYGHWFHGDVHVGGNLDKLGGGFKIDHPLAPGEKYLVHSFVESPERKNIYDGVVEVDDSGSAVLVLPDWFAALNVDYRYQLTSLGSASPELHVADEISEGRFRIAGGVPGQRVSWQVTAVRDDAWARANPLAVEPDKGERERGSYLCPELHGHGPEQSLERALHGSIDDLTTEAARRRVESVDRDGG